MSLAILLRASFRRFGVAAALFCALLSTAHAGSIEAAGLDPALMREALAAQAANKSAIANARYLSIIDYRKRSSEKRLYLVDLSINDVQSFLVAHGAGSDPDHDGYADRFSNEPGSRMTSLGAFVTGAVYYGQHGLSLKLRGLEARNNRAEARAIVIHGADYVDRRRRTIGRSWGCPSLSPADARRIIPLIKDGAFLYVVGAG